MKPYYQDDLVTLYNTESLAYMASMPDECFDVVITDPPYSERTHANAKSNHGKGYGNSRINFDSFTDKDLFAAYDQMGRLTRGWVVSNIDYNHAFRFETEPPENMRQLRIGVWVKNNPMPQISGDRPSQGWEAISYLFKTDKKASWNASGSHGNYVSNLATPTGHPTPKPLSMVSSFVERFSAVGDTVFDPFAGGGTTLLAARNLGRNVIGCEIDPDYCELIVKRLSQQSFDLEALTA